MAQVKGRGDAGTNLLLAFAVRLKRARKAARLTQAQLAARVGYSRVSIGYMEIGRTNPTLTTLALLARALDCSVGDLLPACEREKRHAEV